MKSTTKPTSVDPAPSERIYYRRCDTGDRGYLVWRDGKQCIRYDQPGVDRTLPFRVTDWTPETENLEYTTLQLAQVAFAADTELCKQLGYYGLAKKTWIGLKDEERIEFMTNGPRGEHRRKLFLAIMETLKGLKR